MSRFKSHLYTQEQIVFVTTTCATSKAMTEPCSPGITEPNTGCRIFPEWYAYGRYYKRWGFMSTKGITDMLYIPHKFSNHYLKRRLPLDCLWRKDLSKFILRRRMGHIMIDTLASTSAFGGMKSSPFLKGLASIPDMTLPALFSSSEIRKTGWSMNIRMSLGRTDGALMWTSAFLEGIRYTQGTRPSISQSL